MTDAFRLHDDEVGTDAPLVRRLLTTQFPQWATLDVEPVRSAGTDNAMYRLGADLAVRLPRRPGAVRPIDKEHAWLPRLARLLPLPLPLPVAKGSPGEGYPWPWSVCRWVDGETPAVGSGPGGDGLARDLAAFVRALQATDATGAPGAGGHNHHRGAPLAQWEATITERLGWLADMDAIGKVTAAWRTDSAAPPWNGRPTWIHGDLSAGNLLARDGRLAGVIDWSCLGAGDPACDLQVAWTLFDRGARETFRAAMAVDNATWTRGRAWGLAIGVLNLSYYRVRSPEIAQAGLRAITQVLEDHAIG